MIDAIVNKVKRLCEGKNIPLADLIAQLQPEAPKKKKSKED